MQLVSTRVRGMIPMTAAVAVLMGGALAAQKAPDASLLKPYTAKYAINVQGNPFGTNTVTMAQEGDVWVIKTALESAMFNQTTESRMKAPALTPVSMSMKMSGGADMTMDLKVADGKLTGTATLPEQMGGNKTIDMPMPAGAYLPGMHQVVLGVTPLAVGDSLSAPEFDVRTGGMQPARYKVVAEEKVTVPAGTFDTYKIETLGENPATVWVRKDMPHIVVKQEGQAMPMVIELQSLQ